MCPSRRSCRRPRSHNFSAGHEGCRVGGGVARAALLGRTTAERASWRSHERSHGPATRHMRRACASRCVRRTEIQRCTLARPRAGRRKAEPAIRRRASQGASPGQTSAAVAAGAAMSPRRLLRDSRPLAIARRRGHEQLHVRARARRPNRATARCPTHAQRTQRPRQRTQTHILRATRHQLDRVDLNHRAAPRPLPPHLRDPEPRGLRRRRTLPPVWAHPAEPGCHAARRELRHSIVPTLWRFRVKINGCDHNRGSMLRTAQWICRAKWRCPQPNKSRSNHPSSFATQTR